MAKKYSDEEESIKRGYDLMIKSFQNTDDKNDGGKKEFHYTDDENDGGKKEFHYHNPYFEKETELKKKFILANYIISDLLFK